MTALLQDPRVLIQLCAALIAFGGILTYIKILRRDMTRLEGIVCNGLTAKINQIAITTASIQATCEERGKHLHACERE